jgi:hypothetical protein
MGKGWMTYGSNHGKIYQINPVLNLIKKSKAIPITGLGGL